MAQFLILLGSVSASHDAVMNTNSRDRITSFAQTNFRNHRKMFGIKRADRRSGMYIIGKTGTGKSTLVETMIRQDIENGEGVALLDPHGDLVDRIARSIPDHRKKEIYFNVPDIANPLGFNPLAGIPPEKRPRAASGLLDVFKKIWSDSWGPRWSTCSRMRSSRCSTGRNPRSPTC